MRQLDGARLLRDRGRHLEQPHDLRERGEALPELPEPFREAPDRVEELDQVEDEGGDRPERDLAVLVHRRGGEQHDDQRRRLRKRQKGEQPDVHERRPPPGTNLRLAARAIPLERALLAPERLHDAHAGEPLLQRRQRLGDAIANRVVRTAGAVVEAPTRRHKDRERDERDRGELGGEEDERHHGEDDLERAAHDLHQGLSDELVQGLHVRGQPRNEHARAFALVEAERQCLQLVERGDTQRMQEPLAGSRSEQDLCAHDEGLQGGEAEEDDRRDVEGMGVVLLDPGVHGVADERRARKRDQRRGDHRRGGAEIAAAHRPHLLARLPPDCSRRSAVHYATASRARSAR